MSRVWSAIILAGALAFAGLTVIGLAHAGGAHPASHGR